MPDPYLGREQRYTRRWTSCVSRVEDARVDEGRGDLSVQRHEGRQARDIERCGYDKCGCRCEEVLLGRRPQYLNPMGYHACVDGLGGSILDILELCHGLVTVSSRKGPVLAPAWISSSLASRSAVRDGLSRVAACTAPEVRE